ncbi:MAG: Uma2 family endonuclease [Anaerolineae bacterium]|nr:Uma2 family endonuclease [Anaerolineae bacterium]
MSHAAAVAHMSHAEYLAAEELSDTRHEYLRGEVFAMAGGTPEHGALAAAITIALGNLLGGRPCRVFNSDVRIRIRATGLTTYPDISVVCGQLERDGEDRNAIVNPVLIVEVLFDSTEAYDRGEKAAHYRRIPSLKEYVLVSQHQPRIEVFRRSDAGHWELYEAGAGQQIELASVGGSLDVGELYRDPLSPEA